MSESKEPHPSVPKEVEVTTGHMAALSISDPEVVIKIANKVKKYVLSQGLTTEIQGSDYVQVEGWQYAASLFGLTSKTLETRNESIYEDTVFKWRGWDKKTRSYVERKHTTYGKFRYFSTVAFFNQEGREIARGESMCTNQEVKKHTFDEYAIQSMAQTRAQGKAARMALAFIIKAAGYKPTPAEEMQDNEENENVVRDLPKEIKKKISGFKDEQSLKAWANDMSQWHSNVEFMHLVRSKIMELSGQS